MAFQIPGVDLNPLKGDSFLGLTREQSKTLANIFIVVGILFAIPPFIPDPSDFLSLALAKKLMPILNADLMTALAFTYVLGIALFLIGIWIYPYNTKSLFNGYINKAKKQLKKIMNNPAYVIAGLIFFYIMFNWYKGQV